MKKMMKSKQDYFDVFASIEYIITKANNGLISCESAMESIKDKFKEEIIRDYKENIEEKEAYELLCYATSKHDLYTLFDIVDPNTNEVVKGDKLEEVRKKYEINLRDEKDGILDYGHMDTQLEIAIEPDFCKQGKKK